MVLSAAALAASGAIGPTSYAAQHPAATICAYSNGAVNASGLPTGQVLNFLVTNNATGIQTGWVLGISDTGTWTVPVSVPSTSTTYQFVSKTWGPNGSKYIVYSACTAG